MCFSFKTSLISYSLGMFSAIFALCTRQYVIGMLILIYAQMQLSEAMIWKGIDTDNISLNKMGTNYGKYSLPTHFFFVGVGYLMAILLIKKRKLKFYDFIPVTVGLFFYLYVIFYHYNKKYPEVTYPLDRKCLKEDRCQNNNNRLQWPYYDGWYYKPMATLAVVFVILVINPISTKILLLLLAVGSWVISSLTHPHTTKGSMWCFLCSVLSPILVILNYFIIRNKTDSEILT